jgi:hypothetical protein
MLHLAHQTGLQAIKEHEPTAHAMLTQTAAQAVQIVADHTSLVIAILCE